MLVVDDESSIVDIVSMALRHDGYAVAAAGTGAGALAQVRDWRPHAMVLDVMLPDMDGFEVASRLAAQRADVPILFLSARTTTTDKVRGLTIGGDDYVTKPEVTRGGEAIELTVAGTPRSGPSRASTARPSMSPRRRATPSRSSSLGRRRSPRRDRHGGRRSGRATRW